MAVYYVDSSAIVKRYVVETGAAWITALSNAGAGNACWISAITAVEVVSALFRRVKSGSLLLAQAQQVAAQWRAELPVLFRSLPVDAAVIDRAMELAARHQLRGYDALQLGACLELRAQCAVIQSPLPQLISSDQDLNQAAATEGLLVDDPNLHP